MEQVMEKPAASGTAEPSGRATRINGEAPGGFTLVELMVVIMIIGLIAGLLTPVLMKAIRSARNAAIKAEIDMLHMAIMNYKNEYGSFPPSASPLPWGVSSPAVRHVARLFPRCSNVVAQFDATGFPLEVPANPIAPDTAIVTWLGGFTNNPASPLRPVAARKKLFDFDMARVSGLIYAPPKSPSSPYIYIDSTQYIMGGVAGSFGPYYAHRVPASAASSFKDTTQPAFNPDTFQILCAGRDGQFDTDDDLSNFWPGTRGEYIDSLKK